jgi:hypothetical protein
MDETRTSKGFNSGEDRGFMIEQLVLWAVSCVIALLALAIVGWEVATGWAFSLDGLCLSLICLTLAAVFGGNVAW